MSATPLVSVLMTAYNREKYVGEAVESVLGSSYTNFELIVVDDCSKDLTVEIARGYEIRDKRVKVFVNEVNLGDYPNRNKAASLSKGEYIKYVDSDDILFPASLQKMVNAMEQFPEAGYGLCSVIEDPSRLCITPREAYVEYFSGKGHFDRSPGGAIIRKSAFDEVGGFTGLRQLGDFEFWLTIGACYPMVKLPFDLYWVRDHEEKESKLNNDKEKNQMRLGVLERIFSQKKVPLSEQEKTRIVRSFNRNFFQKIVSKIHNSNIFP